MCLRKPVSPQQIIGKLREAKVVLGQGTSIGEAIRTLGYGTRHAAYFGTSTVLMELGV